jgi:hypothetical protein
MRNRISGYVTTLKRVEEKRKAAMTAEETSCIRNVTRLKERINLVGIYVA